MPANTFSSLNKNFINNYQDTLRAADEACIYFNPENNKQKSGTKIDVHDVENAFNFHQLIVFTEVEDLEDHLLNKQWNETNLLLMTSGHFGDLDLKSVANKIVESTN